MTDYERDERSTEREAVLADGVTRPVVTYGLTAGYLVSKKRNLELQVLLRGYSVFVNDLTFFPPDGEPFERDIDTESHLGFRLSGSPNRFGPNWYWSHTWGLV